MADATDFKELLSKAPMGPDEHTLVVVGVLNRSSSPSKFGLFVSSGGNMTLDVDAVLKHEVLDDSFGHTLVRLTLDAGKVPPETMQKVTGGFGPPQTAAQGYLGAPFVLQHGHHASAATVAAMAAFASNPNLLRTSPCSDYPKDPACDGTWPTPHGKHLDY